MDSVQFGVAPSGGGWAIKHNGGYLGHVRTRSEALEIARMLADSVAAEGRQSRIEVEGPPAEPRSFSPR